MLRAVKGRDVTIVRSMGAGLLLLFLFWPSIGLNPRGLSYKSSVTTVRPTKINQLIACKALTHVIILMPKRRLSLTQMMSRSR